MPKIQQIGQFLQADYFANIGGLNNTDSPFAVTEDQATDGRNWDYIRAGGIRKRLGHQKINTSADAQLKTLGVGQINSIGGSKTLLRAAGTKVQSVDVGAGTFTTLTEDTTTATSDIWAVDTTARVLMEPFNTPTANVLWAVGGGSTSMTGSYSSSKFTTNGVPEPTGSVTPSVAGAGGSFVSTGTYRYVFSFRKASTQAEGNVALEVEATIAATTDEVTLPFAAITNIDTTRFDKIRIYRSAVGGAAGFTSGDLIAIVDSTDASYVDLGTTIASVTTIPRAGNTILDQSELPAGTLTSLVNWKRRLVTAIDNTLYIGDLNKPEAWPTVNTITIPSGGNITALGIISFTTPTSTSVDEFLIIFKERELWILTGTSVADWALKFIDEVGCPSQALVVNGNGFLSWIDSRGVYLWYGSGKPIYVSRTIENFFEKDGDIQLNKLTQGYGAFYRKDNQIVWALSHKSFGAQKMALKLDLRLTLPNAQSALEGTVLNGVFTTDIGFETEALFAGILASESEESLIGGDDAGFLYRMYNAHDDAGAEIDFQYFTKFLDMGQPGVAKRIHKIIVWVEEVGDWDLTVDYWSNYRTNQPDKSIIAEPISRAPGNNVSLWDVGFWDEALWDDYTQKFRGIVYNPNSAQGNSEGDSFKLAFRNKGALEPITITGFSVIYSPIGLRK